MTRDWAHCCLTGLTGLRLDTLVLDCIHKNEKFTRVIWLKQKKKRKVTRVIKRPISVDVPSVKKNPATKKTISVTKIMVYQGFLI